MPEDTSSAIPVTAATTSSKPPQLPNEEPKKKRAKIMSACGECRRKKTKCDGEQPCYNCNKSKSKCVYSSHNLNNSFSNDKRTVNNASKATLEAIEMRLKVIEDMLRTILEQSHHSSASSTSSYNNTATMTLNNFLNNNDNDNNRLPSIQNLSATIPNIHHHTNAASPTSPSPIIKHQRLPSPLSLVNKTEFDIFQYHQQQQRQQQQQQQDNRNNDSLQTSQPIKKRKR
jgi:hypothetical protein